MLDSKTNLRMSLFSREGKWNGEFADAEKFTNRIFNL